MASTGQRSSVPVVYTCGYQGRDSTNLLAEVSRRGIRLLIDVRWKPLSRKPGFSKGRLKIQAGEFRLWYIHVPELGIPDTERREHGQKGGVLLAYERRITENPPAELERIAELARRYPVALMCFEADPEECHRAVLAAVIAEQIGASVVDL